MHGLILCLKSKDVLGALAPGLAVVRIHVGQDMRNAVLEVIDRIAVGVKVSRTVPFTVEVGIGRKSIVAVDGDEKLDSVCMRVGHEVVKAFKNGVIPASRATSLQTIERVDGSILGFSRLA